ncbi:DinB family protein [Thermobifida halotolerans]|uniref:DinB family protein n=2 Tax=Thermobifida halotolerans TaxID=483545 RepID=A0AA97M1G7_9ACTN|nr:DinB family protein [Thermobifida halotolerans]
MRPPGFSTDEKTTLLTFLDYLRESVAAKLAGLTEEQAREPRVPSGTSLLWLVKHLTAVEFDWFAWAYAGVDAPFRNYRLQPTAEETVESVLAAYREAVRHSNEIVRACVDLDRPGVRSVRENERPPSLRWVLVHMVEETARHAGHADILRELTDGAVGR